MTHIKMKLYGTITTETRSSAVADKPVVSPGDAIATITQYVAWMERQFNACQTPRSMYLSSIVSELYDA